MGDHETKPLLEMTMMREDDPHEGLEAATTEADREPSEADERSGDAFDAQHPALPRHFAGRARRICGVSGGTVALALLGGAFCLAFDSGLLPAVLFISLASGWLLPERYACCRQLGEAQYKRQMWRSDEPLSK